MKLFEKFNRELKWEFVKYFQENTLEKSMKKYISQILTPDKLEIIIASKKKCRRHFNFL